MDSPRRTVSGWALAWAGLASLLIHLGWFASPLTFWSGSDLAEDTGPPLEAVLLAPEPRPKPMPPALRPASSAPIAPPVSPVIPPQSEVMPALEQVPVTLPAPITTDPVVPEPGPGREVRPAVATPADAVVPATPSTTLTPLPHNPLPAQLSVQYAVLNAEHGFAIGAATYLWQHDGGRYRAESSLKTTGIVSLFVSGDIYMVSAGHMGTDGLQPETFSQQRGERRRDVAAFDYAAGRLTLNGQPERLRAGAQDLVSFLFQLALRFHPGQAKLILPVTDGRKLRGYRLAPPEAEIRDGRRFWRLHAWRDGDGELDLWFAADQPGLPVLMRSLDRKGDDLWLRMMEPAP